MRLLLLLLLIAGLAGYLYQQRRVNYPVEAITTPAGRSFRATTLPSYCEASPPCVHRAVYLTELTDTAAIKEEARQLLPWVVQQTPSFRAPAAVQLIAVQPGFLQVAPPKAAFSVSFVMPQSGDWRYLEVQDLSDQITKLLKGG